MRPCRICTVPFFMLLFNEILAHRSEDVKKLSILKNLYSVHCIRLYVVCVACFKNLVLAAFLLVYELSRDYISDLFMRMGMLCSEGALPEVQLDSHEIFAVGEDFPCDPSAEILRRYILVLSIHCVTFT